MAQATNTVISPINVDARRAVDVRTGDTVRVHQKIEEGGKTRVQVFEGIVIARKHGTEPGATFTVRRTSGGYGIEKIFPLYSPTIDKIETVTRSQVRRSKMYHIRDKATRAIKRQMRNRLQTPDDFNETGEVQEPQEVIEEKNDEPTETQSEDTQKVGQKNESRAPEDSSTEEKIEKVEDKKEE
jgi:large subunit ribosomal protein L19